MVVHLRPVGLCSIENVLDENGIVCTTSSDCCFLVYMYMTVLIRIPEESFPRWLIETTHPLPHPLQPYEKSVRVRLQKLCWGLPEHFVFVLYHVHYHSRLCFPCQGTRPQHHEEVRLHRWGPISGGLYGFPSVGVHASTRSASSCWASPTPASTTSWWASTRRTSALRSWRRENASRLPGNLPGSRVVARCERHHFAQSRDFAVRQASVHWLWSFGRGTLSILRGLALLRLGLCCGFRGLLCSLCCGPFGTHAIPVFWVAWWRMGPVRAAI